MPSKLSCWTIQLIVSLLAIATTSPSLADVTFEMQALEDGTAILMVSGDFSPGQDLGGFATLANAPGLELVTFNSPGGSVYSAMQLGRLIRQMGMTTIQFRTLECASACSLAFFGGSHRFADPGSIGVHQSSFGPDDDLSASDAVAAVQTVTADVIAYFQEMGISPALLEMALRYDRSDIRYLSSSEMRQFGVLSVEAAESADAGDKPAVDDPGPASPDSPQAPDQAAPLASAGRVRSGTGKAGVTLSPDDTASQIAVLQNGDRVDIVKTEGSWFKVRTSDGVLGYLPNSEVKVDQFLDVGFDLKFVQIGSFSGRETAMAFAGTSKLALSAYQTSSGWYAIALDPPMRDDAALTVLADLKSKGVIPSDSFRTYGNTYVRKVCCDGPPPSLGSGL